MSGKNEIPRINPTIEIAKTVHVTKTLGNYNLIIGQDLFHTLGVDINFRTQTMCWNNVTINRKPLTCRHKDMFYVEEELFFLRQDRPYR